GVTVKGQVVGPDGKPVARGLLVCRSYIPDGYDFSDSDPLKIRDGRFELPGCHPDKAVPVFFLDSKNQLGAMVKLSGKQADDKNLTIRLESCGSARARLLDEKRQPLGNKRVQLFMIITPGPFFGDFTNRTQPTADEIDLGYFDKNYAVLHTDA